MGNARLLAGGSVERVHFKLAPEMNKQLLYCEVYCDQQGDTSSVEMIDVLYEGSTLAGHRSWSSRPQMGGGGIMRFLCRRVYEFIMLTELYTPSDAIFCGLGL